MSNYPDMDFDISKTHYPKIYDNKTTDERLYIICEHFKKYVCCCHCANIMCDTGYLCINGRPFCIRCLSMRERK